MFAVQGKPALLPPLASPGPGRSEGEVDELRALLADDGLPVAAGDVVPRHAVLNSGKRSIVWSRVQYLEKAETTAKIIDVN